MERMTGSPVIVTSPVPTVAKSMSSVNVTRKPGRPSSYTSAATRGGTVSTTSGLTSKSSKK